MAIRACLTWRGRCCRCWQIRSSRSKRRLQRWSGSCWPGTRPTLLVSGWPAFRALGLPSLLQLPRRLRTRRRSARVESSPPGWAWCRGRIQPAGKPGWAASPSAATKAEVLVLCGDLTDVGKPREAEVLADDLRACSIPVVGVLGNHDYESGQAEEVEKILKAAGVHLLNGHSYEANGVAFVGVKGFIGGFGRRMLASFGESIVKSFVAESVAEAMRLGNAMRTVRNERAVVVLHYAPIAETVEGEPLEIFPFLGCSRLSETIDRFKVSAVVHGHAHHGRYQGRTPRGTPVYNVAFPVEKSSGRPYALIKV